MNELYLGMLLSFANGRILENFLPCDGRLLKIKDYNELFNVIGSTYGGDGSTTFALPDLRVRVPVGTGQPTGMDNYYAGYKGGTQSVSLSLQNIPTHDHRAYFTPAGNHPVSASAKVNAGSTSDSNNPQNNYWGQGPKIALSDVMQYTDTKNVKMANDAVTINVTGGGGSVFVMPSGANVPHENMPPFLAINWMIVVRGLYPQPTP